MNKNNDNISVQDKLNFLMSYFTKNEQNKVDKTLQGNVIFMLSLENCPGCIKTKKIIEQNIIQNMLNKSDVRFLIFNLDKLKNYVPENLIDQIYTILQQTLSIQSVPVLLFFKNKKLLKILKNEQINQQMLSEIIQKIYTE